ncbi:MAG: type II toxin-antitoxin system YafQ family toxin [Candidatus Uhrbacteria bacterium]|nr:type II toxin-antitoxin system YafQ family toxin [Candidatus Uhrbacteria bacterium]
MIILYSSKFKREYKKLSLKVKMRAEKKEILFRKNPFDPQLGTHKLKGRLKEFWAFWIDEKNRIIFEFADNDVIWFHSAGDHAVYDLFNK